MTAAARLTEWLIKRYPAEFRRAHERELREASEWTLSAEPNVLTVLRLILNLAYGALAQHAAEFLSDVRYAGRTLGRSKLFAVCAILSLGFGIGTVLPMYVSFAGTVFGAVPGIASPQTLVAAEKLIAYPAFEHLRDSPQSPFAELTAYMPRTPMVMKTGTPGTASERLWGNLVAPRYFAVLGVALYRGQQPARETGSVVIISHRLWQRRFGAQENTVGRQIEVNGQALTIAGIGPPGFVGSAPLSSASDIWVPALTKGFTYLPVTDSKVKAFQITGRLRSGINQTAAEAALDSQMRHLDPRPGTTDDKSLRMRLMPGARVLGVPDHLLPLMLGMPVAIGLLALWIACSNVGAMMLARAASRRKEVAVRSALGAGQGRIVRQLITESLLLSLAGCVVAVLVTIWSLSSTSMKSLLPGFAQLDLSIGFDGMVVAGGSAILCTLLCGLIPAWQVARSGVFTALKAASEPALPRYRWFSLRNQLILQQVAGALCLLLLCGYLVLGMGRATKIDMGFDAQGIGTVQVDPWRDGLPPQQAGSLLMQLPGELAEDPSLTAAALAESSPSALVAGRLVDVYSGSRSVKAGVVRVGAGYFQVLGVPLLRGRTLTEAEHLDRNGRAVLINEAMASELWPKGDPVGETIEMRDRGSLAPSIDKWQVAGVVKNFRNQLFQADAGAAVYRPLTVAHLEQMPAEGWTVIARAKPGASVLDVMRNTLQRRHADLTVFGPIVLEESNARTMAFLNESLAVYLGIGLFGLVLSAVGLAGVTAYAVTLRTREIGIRMALGATSAQVILLVLREGIALLAVGGVVGVGLTLLTKYFLQGYLKLFATATRAQFDDPWLLLLGLATLLGLGMAACYLPARRATRVDPVIALRE